MRKMFAYALTAMTALSAPSLASADEFLKLDDTKGNAQFPNGDAQFNQLLGINNGRVIAGYFGDGSVVPNNGYVLVPSNHYSDENFLINGQPALQTQAIGISSQDTPWIVGFYTKNNGDGSMSTHGFVDIRGTQYTLDDPKGNLGNATNQNLLGIDSTGWLASGFWMDSNNLAHGYVVDFNNGQFIEEGPDKIKNATQTQVAGVNDYGFICGFWVDNSQAKGGPFTHGFFGYVGAALAPFDVVINGVKAVNTQATGCNNEGIIVGNYTEPDGDVHGFLYDWRHNAFYKYIAPGESQTATSIGGVKGTIINGINDRGDFVGFYSDGVNVNGFVYFRS
ncbi:MAG TPA: hypothetical protein VEK34_08310 [Methylocella sp.]|nr:hypothetical protein [Methylocella sp.]